MLVAVLIWFRCFNLVITDDKWLYLTAKISPKISLLLSSALRFVPLLKEQSKKIKNAQKAMGLYSSESWFDKLKSVLRVYSALIGWSLEKAVDTGAYRRNWNAEVIELNAGEYGIVCMKRRWAILQLSLFE